jgi:hypothetical protein
MSSLALHQVESVKVTEPKTNTRKNRTTYQTVDIEVLSSDGSHMTITVFGNDNVDISMH